MFTSSPSIEKLPATTSTLLAFILAAVTPEIDKLFAEIAGVAGVAGVAGAAVHCTVDCSIVPCHRCIIQLIKTQFNKDKVENIPRNIRIALKGWAKLTECRPQTIDSRIYIL